MKIHSITVSLFLLLFTSVLSAQNEQYLCTAWCQATNLDFQSEFGQSGCLYVIDVTPQNNIIFTGWCNYLFSISKSRVKTFSPSGVLLESLYDPSGWVESSYITGNETRLFHSLSDTYPTCNTGSNCNVEIQMVQVTECILPRIVATGQILRPCGYASGLAELPNVVGYKARIGYSLSNGCISTCQQGTPINIGCIEEIAPPPPPAPTTFSDCQTFENYGLIGIVPQGSPKFTLFTNIVSQNATVVNSIAQKGSKSLRISNTTNLDYNIDRPLSGNKLARIDFSFYIPKGKAGVWSVETNNSSIYSVQLVCQNGEAKLYIKENINGVEKLIQKAVIDYVFDRWVPVAIIFQPFEDEMEVWINRKMQNSSTYKSNLIGDLNFSGQINASNNEMYIDDLCYTEWTRASACTQEYSPRCINGVEYGNACWAYNDGYTVAEASMGECIRVGCPQLVYPLDGATDIPTTLTMVWQKDIRATHYRISVSTSDGGIILEDKVLDPVTSYRLINLPESKEILVTIVPENSVASVFCQSRRFRTKSNTQLPSCSNITSPTNLAINLPSTVNITWQAAANATSYRLILGTTAGNNDIFNQVVGNVTSYMVQNLPADKVVCATIIPFNAAGENTTCTTNCFKIKSDAKVPDCTTATSPANNEQNVATTINLLWSSSAGATGYKIKMGSNTNGADILPLTDVGNVTNYIVNNLPTNRFVCTTIIPYSSAGEASNCSNICFKTVVSTDTNNWSKDKKLTLMPNPSNGNIILLGQNLNGTPASVEINAIDGKSLYKTSYTIGEVLNIDFLNSGLYLMSITIDGTTQVQKLVIAK